MSIGSYFAISGINIYQKLVSPRKGYACAYRIYYGDVSCSTYIKQYISSNGLSNIKVVIRERGHECKVAFGLLKSKKPDNLNRKHKKKNSNFDDCYCEAPFEIISCLAD